MRRRLLAITATLAVTGSSVALSAAPALAGHDHFVATPNGQCHQVAEGQTSIDDPTHGGRHRFHDNVHVGATESVENPDSLGDGNSNVQVYRDACPA